MGKHISCRFYRYTIKILTGLHIHSFISNTLIDFPMACYIRDILTLFVLEIH